MRMTEGRPAREDRVERCAATLSVCPPETGAPPPTGRQLAPLGKTTDRAVAPRAVTGATRYLGPSMYWSSTPRQALSSGNS